MTNAKGAQSAPAEWAKYGEGESLVMLVGLWKAVAAQMAEDPHDEPNQQIREILRALGPPPGPRIDTEGRELPEEPKEEEADAAGGA